VKKDKKGYILEVDVDYLKELHNEYWEGRKIGSESE